MRPTQHPNNNAVLSPPPGATADECMPLPITRIEYQDGGDGVVSYWRPDAGELALLNAGQPVRIMLWGRTHPPLHLGVDGDGVL